MNRHATRHRAGARCCSAGESAVGYLVAVALLSLALAVGPDSPLEQLFRAVATHYARFTHAISLP